ncbi:hypothetical protein BV898_12751 [Hypsibius exemplaris]|uniref:Uncharacterized protein n=1 Tax=Hypsibius exemplaris TaxID=2072580 RepID=A0A1W0WCP4_HYPEX|nr:hypothetical protein BV898_12751 [Hypsibius exemplaris]
MRLPGVADCKLISRTMGGEVAIVLSLVATAILAIDQDAAEMGLSNSTFQRPSDTDALQSEYPGNNSLSTSDNSTDSRKALRRDLELVQKHYPHLTHSHLLEHSETISVEGSYSREERQDGLRHLGIPLVCAAVSIIIFGIILFIKKVAQTDQPEVNNLDEDENYVINGDDVMYHWPGTTDYCHHLEEPDDEVGTICRCVDETTSY